MLLHWCRHISRILPDLSSYAGDVGALKSSKTPLYLSTILAAITRDSTIEGRHIRRGQCLPVRRVAVHLPLRCRCGHSRFHSTIGDEVPGYFSSLPRGAHIDHLRGCVASVGNLHSCHCQRAVRSLRLYSSQTRGGIERHLKRVAGLQGYHDQFHRALWGGFGAHFTSGQVHVLHLVLAFD